MGRLKTETLCKCAPLIHSVTETQIATDHTDRIAQGRAQCSVTPVSIDARAVFCTVALVQKACSNRKQRNHATLSVKQASTMADVEETYLKCGVCSEPYRDEVEKTTREQGARLVDRRPALLPCSHTLCLQCLEEKMPRSFGFEDDRFWLSTECKECHVRVNIPKELLHALLTNKSAVRRLRQTQRLAQVRIGEHGRFFTVVNFWLQPSQKGARGT